MKKYLVLPLTMILLFTAFLYSENHPESTSYILLKGHFSNAGGITNSSNYQLISSLGQISPVGKGQSSSYRLYSGIFTPMFSSYNCIPYITNLSALPQADFTATVFPYTVTFFVTVYDIDSSLFDYTWDFGDGETLQMNNEAASLTITHQFAQAKSTGPYTVTCTVSDKLSTNSSTVDVFLGPQAPQVTIEATPTYGARPLTVTFTGSAYDPDGGTVTNYEWDFGDGSPVESGSNLTNVTHTYTSVVSATTIYAVTLSATDDTARVGTATKDITYIPALFFDDFEDGDASDWTQYVTTDWSVAQENTYMLKTSVSDTARHITAPIPGDTISYGTIRVDMKFLSTSSTEYTTGMIIWGFASYSEYRYLKVDYKSQKIFFGLRQPNDLDRAEFAANGWSIPINQVFNITVIFRADGTAVAKINDTVVGSYEYEDAKNGAVGLATRKSETFFDNFLVTQSTDTNLPPTASVEPKVYASLLYPATVSFTATATDPDGSVDDLSYFWRFGDGNTAIIKNPTNIYLSEGIFVATLDVTDSGLGSFEPETTTVNSFINVGVDFYDNFEDGDISNWLIETGSEWSVVNGRLVSGVLDTNHKIFAPYPANMDLGYGTICTTFNIQPKTTNTKQNAIIIIGHRDEHLAYRFIRFDNDTNSIAIMHDDDQIVEQTDAAITYTVPLNQDHFTCAKVEPVTIDSDKVTVYLNGKQMLTYTYGYHWSGKWGLRAGKSVTQFDDVVIFDPSTLNSTAPDIDTNYKNIDIGEVRLDSATGQTMLLDIYNRVPPPQGDDLVVSELFINSTEFTVEDPATGLPISSLANPIPAGGSTTVQIRYKPTDLGIDTAQLRISSNDPDEPAYIVNLQGEGVNSLRPIATITISPPSGSGPIPLVVNFSATATDPDGDDNAITYQWDFGDGSPVNNNSSATHTYLSVGQYSATLILTDEEAQTNTYYRQIKAEYYQFLDTFNDQDISDWTPAVAANWYTINDNGEIRLRGSNLNAAESINAPSAAYFMDTGIIEFDMKVGTNDGNQVKIKFDVLDGKNQGYVLFDFLGNNWSVNKVVNGTTTKVGTGNAILNRNQWSHYKIEFANGLVTISISEQVLVNNVNYGSFKAGMNGLALYKSAATFDNYKILFTAMTKINEPPTLNIDASPTSGYSPQEVTFAATADDPDGNNAFITYRWDFGDSSGTSTAQNPVYTYTSTGTFTATCVVTDSGFPPMTATDTIVIDIVEGNHPPSVSIQATPQMGIPPLEVTFTSTVTDDENNVPFAYQWNFGDGSPVSNDENPIHTFTDTGLYTVTCTVTDSGIPPRSGSRTTEVNVSYWIITFQDNFDDGNIDGWETAQTTAWRAYQYGSGQYRLYGEYSSASSILAPVAAEFRDGNIIEFDFIFPSSTVQTKNNLGFIFDYVSSGNYTIVYINGGSKIELKKYVNSTPTILYSTAIAALVDDTTYHFKATLLNNALKVELGSTTVINSYNYGSVSAYRTGFLIYQSAVYIDNYKVQRDSSLDGNHSPEVTVNASTTTGQPPLEVTFTSTVSDIENDVPFTYEWNFGDGSPYSSEENPVHTFTSTGTYTVTLNVTDSGTPPMTGSDTVEIDVSNYALTFQDNFNDGNISDWEASPTSAWSALQQGSGEYRLLGEYSSAATISAPSTAEFRDGNMIESDFRFPSDRTQTKNNLGFVFDYISAGNYTMVYINGGSKIELRKYVNSSVTILYTTSITTLVDDTWYHMKTYLVGNNLTFEINGIKIIDAFNYGSVTSYKTGFFIYISAVLIDDYEVFRDAT